MTTATLTLTDFLLARIAEDEEQLVTARRLGVPPLPIGSRMASGMGNHPTVSETRLAAECEAKRRIVEAHVAGPTGWHEDDGEPVRYCEHCHRQAPCLTLRALAVVYADRQDYREEWREEWR